MAGLFSPEERLLTPPGWTGIDEGLPVAFVGGPIQGAPDFQTPLAWRLIEAHSELFVASPRTIGSTDGTIDHKQQAWWEQAYLGRAAFNGVVLFWLVAQDHSSNLSEQAYNQAAWSKFSQVRDTKNKMPQASVHLGIDPEFTNHDQDHPDRYFRLLAKHAGINVHESLTDLEAAALDDLA